MDISVDSGSLVPFLPSQAQGSLQATRLGKTLQSSYLDRYLGVSAADGVLETNKAVVRGLFLKGVISIYGITLQVVSVPCAYTRQSRGF